MRIAERLETLVAVLPEDATIELRVSHLRRWLEEEGGPQNSQASAMAAPLSAVVDLTASDLAKLLGRAPSTIRAMCAGGAFPGAYRMNRKEWRIPHESVRQFQDAQRERVRMRAPTPARTLSQRLEDL